jgi:hypothetical protein
MSTKQTTTGSNQSTLQFNPAAQGIYNNLVKQGGSQLSDMIQNPFGNAMYSLGLGQSQKGAAQQGANNMGVLNQNQKAQGLNGQGGAGFMAAQRAMMGRSNASMMSGANTSNVFQALQRQMAATGMGMSFSPQLTGQKGSFNQTQETGGLGTWLPQLIGTAAGAAIGGLTSGAGGAAGKGGTSIGSLGGLSSSSAPGGGAFSGFGLGSQGAPASGMWSNPMSSYGMMGMMN